MNSGPKVLAICLFGILGILPITLFLDRLITNRLDLKIISLFIIFLVLFIRGLFYISNKYH